MKRNRQEETRRILGQVKREEFVGRTAELERLIAHASRDEYLRPGEVLGSGTVGGGSGAERGTLLHRGDVVELEVERLGTLRNRVV